MFKVGDVCQLIPRYTMEYTFVRIQQIDGLYYKFETDVSTTDSCHIKSLMAKNFHLITSNVSSLAEFKSTYPEYFV